jgi:hypothetical protein
MNRKKNNRHAGQNCEYNKRSFVSDRLYKRSDTKDRLLYSQFCPAWRLFFFLFMSAPKARFAPENWFARQSQRLAFIKTAFLV